MCEHFGIACEGYKKDIFFDFESSSGNNGARFRRPLLSLEDRERMSEWLTSSAPPKQTLKILSHIDETCEKAPLKDDVDIHRGPFGAFRITQGRGTASLPVPCEPVVNVNNSEDTNSSSPQEISTVNNNYELSTPPPLSPWSQGLMHLIFDQPGNVLSPPSPGFLEAMLDSQLERNTEPHEYMPLDLMPDPHYNNATSPTSLSSASTTISVPHDAVFLLKHYASAVISLMTPLRHSKTPWHVLFIPHAKNCLAALALNDEMSHACLCAFYGTLSISAFSLGGVSRSQTWLEKAMMYKQEARKHARMMLTTAYDVPKVAKYKSILMALLTMVQVSIFSGNRSETECYFLEAEKFIRLRGLKRKKSRKVRLLHHCYAFERIIHESIFICGANSTQRHHIRTAIESSGLGMYSLDSLSFRLTGWKNLNQEMMRVRGQEEGENDLHLERPGFWSSTLYPEIFGIPEQWIFLLSQVIRLGKEKDTAEGDGTRKCLSLKEFIGRAKTLEDSINNLHLPSRNTSALENNNNSQLDQDIIDNMLEAMQNALAIYFYRRVHDVDASILQTKVVGVLDRLLRCQQADSTVVHGSAGFIWPAFIAACEAEDSSVQVSFSNWFENSACRSGLSCFTDTLDNIQRIWQEKSCANGKSVTWLDLMKNTVPLQSHL
ncbi:hypothetical protein PENANT_c001G02805 [Penicillium antarcticum]|uniref:Transcription factor domain-containing protein n=2 Tax=Penicillium antarcticum TaxID=416450 RepID=A0A1V6QN05_9EURO|nr:hypothetical protein PENANT_c001G02805 [Penicillium antarcticum]